MAANDPNQKHSFPDLKYPALRDEYPRSAQRWVKGKQLQDGAEGFWRIHDSLYDLTEFVSKHPGGRQWIEFTKGTDITEAFETHHLKGIAEGILPKYFIRSTRVPRNSPFTFAEDGFYRTLKPKIYAKLKELPKDLRSKSDHVTDTLLVVLFVLAALACWSWSFSYILCAGLVVGTGFVMSALATCAHNYFHRTDCWRMFLFNLSGMSYSDWRITHAISHHLFTNTLQDIELSQLEPLLQYMPYPNKTWFQRMAAFYSWLIFPFLTLRSLSKRMLGWITGAKTTTKIDWENMMVFILPTWMFVVGGANTPLVTLGIWIFVMLTSSFFFSYYGRLAGHHADANFFDGDIPRATTLDWGLHQLCTVIDRTDYAGSHFKSLTRFGDHTLHHLFPTLDHAYLDHLYPIVIQHCKKFETQLRGHSALDALLSHSKQLLRTTPNDFRLKKN